MAVARRGRLRGDVAGGLPLFPSKKLFSELIHISCSHRQQEISFLDFLFERASDVRAVGDEARGTVPARRRRVGHERARHAFARRLARAVDGRHEEDVRVQEHRPEVRREVLRAGVEMRLEERDDAPVRVRLAGGRERRGDLRRVVRVVVDHDDAARLAFLLESPDHAREFLERAGGDPERNRQLARDGERARARSSRCGGPAP